MKEWLSENWLWLAVLIYLTGIMVYCHYIGFLRTALSFLTAVVAIVITRLVLPWVTGWATRVFHLEEIPVFRFNILVFIAVFVITMILLKLLIKATDIVTNIPVIHGLNQIAGAVLGLAMGLIFLWIACLVVRAFNETGWATEVIIRIYDSRFLTFLFDHNMISIMLRNAVEGIL